MPPKRKWPAKNSKNASDQFGRRQAHAQSTHHASSIPQDQKRSKVENGAGNVPENTVGTSNLPATAPGDPEPRPFSDLATALHPSLLSGLAKMGFQYMTPVQQKVLTELPAMSSDCVVQAKTGTGKTIAFLLPALQSILQGNPPPRGKVGILVICPTRELALQIKQECDGVIAGLSHMMQCHIATGGTGRAASLNAFYKGNPTVLVATPGRLDDILGEEEVRDRFTHLKTLVLDEADQMLDAGFAPAIHKILKRVPSKNDGWQGMCFSATLPKAVLDVAKIVLYPGYVHLSTITVDEVPTHERVPQYFLSVPTVGDTFPALSALIEEEYSQNPNDFKAIVFGTTANGVGLLFDLYKNVLPQFKVFELHSRMSQPQRTKTTAAFKDASSGVLFASDVVGRGMDFPNVGLVIQLGLPSSGEQYVHRVGRTARAGKQGRAVLVLSEPEAFFPRTNKNLPIQPYPVDITSRLDAHRPTIERAFTNVDEVSKSKAYQAFLGYNKTFSKKLRFTPEELVRVANSFAESMGCPEPPMIEKKVVGKMGLKGVKGLNVGSRP